MTKTLDNFDVRAKRVFLRVDLNVPMRDGIITDMTRLDRVIPSILELVEKKAIVIIASHFGRPEGKKNPKFSLEPITRPLSAALGGKKIRFLGDCIGHDVINAVEACKPGDIVLLENLRFHLGEEQNEMEFAKHLALLADVYINDAFSASHRAHASTVGLTSLLPSAAGRLMAAEITALGSVLGDPVKPLGAIVGGSKISSKLELLGNLVGKVDVLAIGGAMANTFLHALGTDIGKSMCESDMSGIARDIMVQADNADCEILLPSDAVVANKLSADALSQVVLTTAIPENMMIFDIGPGSANSLATKLGKLKTLVWNGPLGAFEIPPFDAGTVMVAKVAADLTRGGFLKTVAGGGDTVAALSTAEVVADFSYVSTAGGAFLEWLEGKVLPGVQALN